MTAFKIYRRICDELGIMFPLQQKDLSLPVNPIPNSLEFSLRSIHKKLTYDEIWLNREHRARTYYKVCKKLGFEQVELLSSKKETFKLQASEYPDRKVNLHTVISILYLSGFRDDELLNRSIKYLNNP